MTSNKKYDLFDGPLKVYNIKIMHGANYFSGGKVVVLLLDLKEYDEVFTNQIEGFYEKLVKKMPSLYEHHCSVGKIGGFFQRVKEGTLLGHVIEHTAIEFQTLAGMDVGFGKTRMAGQKGVYNVVFRFFDEIAGVFAGKSAVNLINSILTDQEFDTDKIVQTLIDIRENRLLGPSTSAIVEEAKNRQIPFFRLDDFNLIQLGTGKYQKKLRATITSDTNHIAIETADDKFLCNLMLKDAGIPVPETFQVNSVEEIYEIYKKLKIPIVIKPKFGSSGEGVSINLNTKKSIQKAYKWADPSRNTIIVQNHIKGNTYRLLVIDFQFSAAVKLVPPFIKGDGKKTIKKLIEELNNDPKRNSGYKSRLTLVEIDEITRKIFSDKKYNIDTVLSENEILYLKISGNLKNGGIALDVSDQVHPANKFFAERAAKVIGLNVAGIDIIAENIRESILDNNGRIIEVNAAPDFRMHLKPTFGKDRNVAKSLVNMLFPDDTKKRIPAFSITGTRGKTFTADLLTHCLQKEGYVVGKTTSNGYFINDHLLRAGNLTSSKDATLVLRDPSIDCAVLETSLEGILEDGLGYEFVDFAIVLNIKNEYDFNKINVYKPDLEEIAYVKSVVAEQVYDDGYVILNADDNYVEQMRKQVYAKTIMFSQKSDNKKLKSFLKKGGTAIVINEDNISIQTNKYVEDIMNLAEIPVLLDNQIDLENFLAVAGILYAFGFSNQKIIESFRTFSQLKFQMLQKS